MSKKVIIGIAGASGSGKTLLADNIVKTIGSDKVVVIREDSYYKDLPELSLEQKKTLNYDHPDSLDHELWAQQLKSLQQGESIEVPVYDFVSYSRTAETRTIAGDCSIIILEGVLLFVDQLLRDIMDIRIFVDTPLDICFIRRLQRDVIERGRTMESVIEQYLRTVRPMFLQFVEPSKRYADINVPQGGKNKIAIEVIQAKMKEMLKLIEE